MEFHFNSELATRYGIDEAVFIHNLYFWVAKNKANKKNIFDGKAWTYNTAKALTELFPFWTDRQIQRIIKNCRSKGLIETKQLSENKRDRTLYYTVTKTVECIYTNGGMDTTKRVQPFTQTVECIYSTDNKPDNKPDRERETLAPQNLILGEFENVQLTQAELDKLNARWTQEQVSSGIEDLSIYLRNSKKKYSSHYATLLNWLKKDFPEQAEKQAAKSQKTTLIEEKWCCG